MRVLIDHCIDWRLKRFLLGHTVQTAEDMGWDALRNGLLLDQAQASGFDVLLTVDKGFRHQQNLAGRSISVILMRVRNNRLPTLVALAPDVLALLPTVQPGQLYEVPLPAAPPVPPPIP
jgi:predicted nuclease of predicted toxin-antitoxin system